MRWQLLLLLGLAAVCLAYDWEAPYSDAEDTLDDLIDDSGEFRTSKALGLLEKQGLNAGTRGRAFKLPFPVIGAAAVGTLAKVALLVLIGTGTIPTTIGNTTIPGPIVGFANTTTAVLKDLKAMLTTINTVTAIVEMEKSSRITGELFLAQATFKGASGTTLITGTLQGMDRSTSYRIDVATNGDLVGGCAAAGPVYSSKSGGLFVSDNNGKALLTVRVADAPLAGPNTVMGRSVVITKPAAAAARLGCGTIVRG